MTMHGMILGTAAYMSPEQATGKLVDKRSDLWALGVVLLEMLTGRQVFGGETVSHTEPPRARSELTRGLPGESECEYVAGFDRFGDRMPRDTPREDARLARPCGREDREWQARLDDRSPL